MTLVVYTASFGDDILWSALPGCEDIQHIAFVDKLKTEAGVWERELPVLLPKARVGLEPTWEQRIVIPEWGNRRTARYYKTLPHRHLPEADTWLWVDDNVRTRIHPRIVANHDRNVLVAQRHWKRKCVYEEIASCIGQEKGDPELLRAQEERYRQAGMPELWGLAQTGVLIRRNTAAIQELSEMWWAEITKGSCRDQVSLPFVCWTLRLKWSILVGPSPMPGRGEFVYVKHGTRVRP